MKSEIVHGRLEIVGEDHAHSEAARRVVVETRGITGSLVLANGVLPEADRNGQTVRVVINPDPIGAVHVWVYLSDRDLQSLAESLLKHLDAIPDAPKEERIALAKDVVFQTLNALPR